NGSRLTQGPEVSGPFVFVREVMQQKARALRLRGNVGKIRTLFRLHAVCYSTFNSANPEVNVGKIGLSFGSDEGNTERVAYRIQRRFGEDVVDVMDIADVTQLEFADYDRIILGIPTWDFGQIQSDWEEFWDDIAAVDFSDRKSTRLNSSHV